MAVRIPHMEGMTDEKDFEEYEHQRLAQRTFSEQEQEMYGPWTNNYTLSQNYASMSLQELEDVWYGGLLRGLMALTIMFTFPNNTCKQHPACKTHDYPHLQVVLRQQPNKLMGFFVCWGKLIKIPFNEGLRKTDGTMPDLHDRVAYCNYYVKGYFLYQYYLRQQPEQLPYFHAKAKERVDEKKQLRYLYARYSSMKIMPIPKQAFDRVSLTTKGRSLLAEWTRAPAEIIELVLTYLFKSPTDFSIDPSRPFWTAYTHKLSKSSWDTHTAQNCPAHFFSLTDEE